MKSEHYARTGFSCKTVITCACILMAQATCAIPAVSNLSNLQVSKESLDILVALAEQYANTNRMSCKSIEITPHMERPLSTPGVIVTYIGKRGSNGFYSTVVQAYRNTAWTSIHEMMTRGESTLSYPLSLGPASTNWFLYSTPIAYPSYKLRCNGTVNYVALYGKWSHAQVRDFIARLQKWLAVEKKSKPYDISHLQYIGPLSSTRIMFGFSIGYRDKGFVFDVVGSDLRYVMETGGTSKEPD